MTDDAINQENTSPETPGTTTEESVSPEPKVTESELVASARKRQAGAEAARQVAQDKYEAAQKKLEAYEAKDRTAAETEAGELATLKAKLEAAEARANEADAKAEARILDAKYPNARKDLQNVTDEATLAKFEAMLRDDDVAREAPTPRGVNPPKAGNSEPTPPKEDTIDDIIGRLKVQIGDGPIDWTS